MLHLLGDDAEALGGGVPRSVTQLGETGLDPRAPDSNTDAGSTLPPI